MGRAGSGKLILTSSVTGSGTLTEWEYIKKEGTNEWETDWTDISSTSTSLSHIVSSLTNATNYQFKVRAVNATGDGAASDASTATSPAAPGLAGSSPETATATITISNFTPNWYYKANAAPDNTCKGPVSGTAKNLTGLSGNTSYTYKAYSDTSCSTTALATATAFVTKPGKPSKPSAAGAGSQKLLLSATVTGDGSITGWEFQQKHGTNNYGSWTAISNSASKSLSHTVSGLTNGDNYKFKVRAKNATGTGVNSDESDTATPSDRSLSSSNVGTTTATLTIAGHAGDWYYKANAAPDTGCKGPVTGLTKDLTGLSTNTSYLYVAYSDSSCTSGNQLATAPTFLTKPGKAATPTVATNQGSGKLTISSSVTGNGTLSKWQYQQKASTDSDFGSWQNISNSTATSLSHTVGSLTDGTSYQFKVRAVNTGGDGAASNASTARTPTAPTLGATSVQAATATLTIGKYNPAWHYKANAAPDNTCKGPVSAGTKTKSLTGLSGNTSYTYTAYSDSSCSTSLVSSSAFLTKPGKPAKPTASVAGSRKLLLAASVTGSGTLTKWEYQQQKDGGSWGSWTNANSTDASLSYTVSNLTNGSSYKFRVRATNATGLSAISDASDAATPVDRSLAASSVEAETATLTISGYVGTWHYKANAAPDTSCSSAVTGATKNLTGLSTNTSYTYEAYSDSTCTTANKLATAAAFLTKPDKASKPTAGRAGSTKLRLTSSVTGNGAIAKWQYQQKSDGSFGSWQNITSTSTSLSHTVTGLTNATSYQFKVRAVNATGNGAASDASDAATPAAPSLATSSVAVTTATLTISNYAPNWHYKYTAPTGGSCSTNAVTGTSVNLASLTGNTNYTFKAYSDSSCSDLLATASEFLTKPGKPSKPTAVGAGTQKLLLSASVGGDGTLSKWEYQQSEDGGNFGSWSDISSTSTDLSHTVTGLDNSKTYQFKVRATNATGTSAASAASDDAQPSTKSLSPSKIKATTVTLTIGGHTGNWYYKANVGPHATCKGPVTGSSVDLTGLSSNTSYTYTAYSDSGCSTAVVAASPFPTLPAKPTQFTVGGDGSQKLRLTASVAGTATLVRWQYQQKEGGGQFGSWNEHRQLHLDHAGPHGERADQRHQLPVQGAGGERQRQWRGLGRLGGGQARGAGFHR